jgi:hypothetical protein
MKMTMPLLLLLLLLLLLAVLAAMGLGRRANVMHARHPAS